MGRRALKIMVSGMIAGDPGQGGATWAVLQYLLGLRRLGHDVCFVEPITRVPPGDFDRSTSAEYFRSVVSDFGLEQEASLLVSGTHRTVGLSYERLRDIGRQTDVLINISGMLTDAELLDPIPVRVYLDLDPAFIQLWHAVDGIDMRFAAHTHFVTIGQAIGSPECAIPTCGRTWIPMAQPCVLEHWPIASTIVHDAWTTIGNWRGYGSIHWNGAHYGQKAHALRPLMDLPMRTRERILLALAIHGEETKDLEALSTHRWHLCDPRDVAGTPDNYRAFIQGSKAEFGLAKSGYAVSRCGWFSDRSICYLASGRPVLAQDTAFDRWLPVGAGLLSFATVDDALAGMEAICADYPRHARAARDLAEGYFDSDKVLARLLDQIGVTS